MSADITLVWMISQMIKRIISEEGFDMDYIKWRPPAGLEWVRRLQIIRLWGRLTLLSGRIDESFTPFYMLTHSLPRTPDQYWETDGRTGKPKNVPCQGTNERVHAIRPNSQGAPRAWPRRPWRVQSSGFARVGLHGGRKQESTVDSARPQGEINGRRRTTSTRVGVDEVYQPEYVSAYMG